MGLTKTPNGALDQVHVVKVGDLPAGSRGQQSFAKDESLSRLSVHNTVFAQICMKVHQRFCYDDRRLQNVPVGGGSVSYTHLTLPTKRSV